MRLLDLVVQSREPFIVLPHANDGDDLTRACAELAFSDGDQLVGCLDLIRIPAPRLWIEWNDAVHQEVIARCGIVDRGAPGACGRATAAAIASRPGSSRASFSQASGLRA